MSRFIKVTTSSIVVSQAKLDKVRTVNSVLTFYMRKMDLKPYDQALLTQRNGL